MKKILFLINTLKAGGAEKALVNIVNGIDKGKFDVTVQTIAGVGVYKSQLASDVHFECVYKESKNFIYKLYKRISLKLLCLKKDLRKFYKRKIDDKYDVEIAFLEGLSTKILSFSDNKNKIAWVHTDLYTYYQGQQKVYGKIEYNVKAYRQYKKIAFVSNSAKEGFLQRFGSFENLVVQYNPFDENNILEKSKEQITEVDISDKFKVVSVGRLAKEKGYDRLLLAHKRLVEEGFDYELWLVGEGAEREKLESFIKENALQKNVKLLGFQLNPYKFIKNAHLFICSSYVEGLSSVVIETAIIGKPIVTTLCPGMKEILGDSEYGLIVENSTQGIYEGIKKMLEDKSLLKKYEQKAIECGRIFKLDERIKEIEKMILEEK